MPPSDPAAAAPTSLEAGLAAWQGFHQEVLARMSTLALALERQDRAEMERTCGWALSRLEDHHRWEEAELLPRLVPAGAVDLAAALRADHREMVRLATLALDANPPAGAWNPGEPARQLLDLVRHHLDIEQHRVLPLLQGRRIQEPPPGAGYHTPPRWRG